MEWMLGLFKSGIYWEGFVDKELDTKLDLHKRLTGTTFGTRTSLKFPDKK